MRCGGQTMYGRLRSVVVRAPGSEFATADPAIWNYAAPLDEERAEAEHRGLLEPLGIELLPVELPYFHGPASRSETGFPDRDPMIGTP